MLRMTSFAAFFVGKFQDVARVMQIQLPITDVVADRFAESWLEAWNAHDIDQILSFYSDEIIFYSPFAVEYPRLASGEIHGLDHLRSYWSRCLKENRDLSFGPPEHIITGSNSICVIYSGALGLKAVETMIFNHSGKIVRGSCQYLDRIKSGLIHYGNDILDASNF